MYTDKKYIATKHKLQNAYCNKTYAEKTYTNKTYKL